MRFSIDPWDPTYGTSLGAQRGESSAEVDVDVEVPAAEWAPIDPSRGLAPPSAVLFVDGADVCELATGDSIDYRSSVPHRIVNGGTTTAEVMWIISPPSY